MRTPIIVEMKIKTVGDLRIEGVITHDGSAILTEIFQEIAEGYIFNVKEKGCIPLSIKVSDMGNNQISYRI